MNIAHPIVRGGCTGQFTFSRQNRTILDTGVVMMTIQTQQLMLLKSEVNTVSDDMAWQIADIHKPVLITNKSDLELLSNNFQFREITMISEMLEEIPNSSFISSLEKFVPHSDLEPYQ
jgi:hypothetical protein